MVGSRIVASPRRPKRGVELLTETEIFENLDFQLKKWGWALWSKRGFLRPLLFEFLGQFWPFWPKMGFFGVFKVFLGHFWGVTLGSGKIL